MISYTPVYRLGEIWSYQQNPLCSEHDNILPIGHKDSVLECMRQLGRQSRSKSGAHVGTRPSLIRTVLTSTLYCIRSLLRAPFVSHQTCSGMLSCSCQSDTSFRLSYRPVVSQIHQCLPLNFCGCVQPKEDITSVFSMSSG